MSLRVRLARGAKRKITLRVQVAAAGKRKRLTIQATISGSKLKIDPQGAVFFS